MLKLLVANENQAGEHANNELTVSSNARPAYSSNSNPAELLDTQGHLIDDLSRINLHAQCHLHLMADTLRVLPSSAF